MQWMARVLIVEDEAGIADAARYALKADGLQVSWALTLGQAWQIVRTARIDAVVLDIGLPDGSGFDFCRAFRLESDVPILFLTARDAEVDRVVGLELGGDDYIGKPFSPRELAARVRANLRRVGVQTAAGGRRPTAAIWSAGLFAIDEDRRQIRLSDAVLNLSAQQYRLLLTFLRQPERVFAREDLLAAAWDEPDMSEARTVDSHIRDLRACLRAVLPVGVEVLVTHRGAGYSCRPEGTA